MNNIVVEVRRQNVETQANRFCKQNGGNAVVVYDGKLGIIMVYYNFTLNGEKMQAVVPITLSEASKVTVYSTIVRRIAGEIYETIREDREL